MTEQPTSESVKAVCEFFWDLEQKYDLFNQTDNGVYYWKLVRFSLYYDLVEQIELFGKPHPSRSMSFTQKILDRLSRLKAMTIDNAFLKGGQHPVIVMPHHRQVHGKDIYSDALINALPNDDTLILYRDYIASRYDGSTVMEWSLVKNRFLRKLSKHLKNDFQLSESNQQIIATIAKDFKERFGTDLNMMQNITRIVDLFNRDYTSYRKLFKRQKATDLYINIAYHNHPAMAAAQNLGIRITELQHGTITRYHLGYSFPQDGINIPYFPDRLLCFGDFWADHTPLPNNIQTTTIGAPYLDKILGNAEKPIEKKEKQILVASQGAIGHLLFPFIIEAAKLNPDYTFIFRLHPSENLEKYQEFETVKNLSLSTKSPDIYSLLKDSDYQIGVFSTTLLEAMKLGCKTICIDLPGVEYMHPSFDRGDAILIKKPEELSEALKAAKQCKDPAYYYAQPIEDWKELIN